MTFKQVRPMFGNVQSNSKMVHKRVVKYSWDTSEHSLASMDITRISQKYTTNNKKDYLLIISTHKHSIQGEFRLIYTDIDNKCSTTSSLFVLYKIPLRHIGIKPDSNVPNLERFNYYNCQQIISAINNL
jgi:hypothetical protein